MAQQVKTLKILGQSLLTTESRAVSFKNLTSNLVTLTTATAHNIIEGNYVTVTGIDAIFNGNQNVSTVPNNTSFTYPVTASNVVTSATVGASVSYVPETIVYTCPASPSTQTLISTITVTNCSDVDGTFFLAVVKTGETLSKKHYIAWGPGILARDQISLTLGLTITSGDKIVAFGAPNIAISLFGGEIV